MKKNILYIGSILFVSVYNALCLYSQNETNNFEQQWDKKTIQEAEIWQNLLVNYYLTDRSYQWNTRRQSIQKVLEQFPNSHWADDAALMLACDEAVIQDDFDGGISSLRKIMFDYPNASTILSGWDSDIGCKINSTWLLWAHRLVSSKRDSITTLTFPFDKDKDIDILENEALVYFAQLEEYPNLTKDMAQYIIASMLIKKGDISDAILELEDLISTAEISSIRAFDYEAANKPYGYLLGCELPHDMVPIWRVQYDATIKLIELYRIEDNTDKALQLSLELANKSSPDGWYWNINRYAGDICLKMGKYGLAAEQYELSLAGINRMIAIQSDRYERLYEQGNVVKHANFSSWEEEAANLHFGTIKEIEDLLSQARNH